MMCSKGDAASVSPGDSCRVIEVPQVEDCLQPVVNIVPLQVYLLLLCLVHKYAYALIHITLSLVKWLLISFIGSVR